MRPSARRDVHVSALEVLALTTRVRCARARKLNENEPKRYARPARSALRHTRALLLVCCFSASLQSCADEDSKTEKVDTYAAVQALFSAAPYSCGNFGCHGSGVVSVESRDWIETRVDQ